MRRRHLLHEDSESLLDDYCNQGVIPEFLGRKLAFIRKIDDFVSVLKDYLSFTDDKAETLVLSYAFLQVDVNDSNVILDKGCLAFMKYLINQSGVVTHKFLRRELGHSAFLHDARLRKSVKFLLECGLVDEFRYGNNQVVYCINLKYYKEGLK